jgi:S-adenosylmethionine synthetase
MSGACFPSESVTEGHPDKLCDAFSDALVGAYLRQDPLARVAAECAVSTGIVFASVKQRSLGAVDVPRVVREVIADVGYDAPDFNPRDCTVMTSISEVEPPPHVARSEELMRTTVRPGGRLHPLTVFGYACDHTADVLPFRSSSPIVLPAG